jgi:hypothetical protein
VSPTRLERTRHAPVRPGPGAGRSPADEGEARPLENQASATTAPPAAVARFAADLRRLQDGEARLTRGFSSFGELTARVQRPLGGLNKLSRGGRYPSWARERAYDRLAATPP